MKLDEKITFGKHKGVILKTVIDRNPSYIVWCVNNIEWFKLNQEAKDYFKERLRTNYVEEYTGNEYGAFDCPGADIGIGPSDYGIDPWGNS